MFHVIEKYRVSSGPYGSDASYGNNGAFTFLRSGVQFAIIASDGAGWEHVSVHLIKAGKPETPSWEDMCFVKSLFWDEDDCVIQYHPAKSQYVNLHPNTLHLWRPVNTGFPIPNKIMVGI